MSFLIYHDPWQPDRMVITLPGGMRMADRLAAIIAYDSAMTANDAIRKMILDSK